MNTTRARTVTLLLFSLGLVSCGGGGGSDRKLTVDFEFQQNYAYLWRDTSIEIVATGLDGNAPVCMALQSNPLPAGLSFAPNSCRVVGVPTEQASGTVVVRLTVPGFDGEVQKSLLFSTLGPSFDYTFVPTTYIGYALTMVPYPRGEVPTTTPSWTTGPGETILYSISSGKLPEGLVLDSNTGVISGLIAEAPNTSFAVAVSAISSGRVFSKTGASIKLDIREGLIVNYPPRPGNIGQSFSLSPLLSYPFGRTQSDFSLTNFRISNSGDPLPAGLAIDSDTGAISGVPIGVTRTNSKVLFEVTSGGQSATFESITSIEILP